MNMAPTLAHCVWPLPPEGAAAPAAWQSQIRGPCLKIDPYPLVSIVKASK